MRIVTIRLFEVFIRAYNIFSYYSDNTCIHAYCRLRSRSDYNLTLNFRIANYSDMTRSNVNLYRCTTFSQTHCGHCSQPNIYFVNFNNFVYILPNFSHFKNDLRKTYRFVWPEILILTTKMELATSATHRTICIVNFKSIHTAVYTISIHYSIIYVATKNVKLYVF